MSVAKEEFNNLPAFVAAQIGDFQALHDRHFALMDELMKVNSPTLKPFAPRAVAAIALNRSLRLMVGFLALMERRNLTASSALIRMQIDSAMRVNACFLVADPLDLLNALRNGDPLSRLRSSTNERLTDRYLHEQLSQKHSWVSSVYEDTSGYVHLSKPHADAAIQGPALLGMIVQMSTDESTPDADIEENAKLFLKATEMLLQVCESLIPAF